MGPNPHKCRSECRSWQPQNIHAIAGSAIETGFDVATKTGELEVADAPRFHAVANTSRRRQVPNISLQGASKVDLNFFQTFCISKIYCAQKHRRRDGYSDGVVNRNSGFS